MRLVHWLIGILLLLSTHKSYAQLLSAMPLDRGVERYSFYLLTAGTEKDLYQQWGHTMLRIHDAETNRSFIFNWGVFDFDAPNFGWNFFKGILIYKLAVQNMNSVLRSYEFEQRSLWEDKITLTSAQKQKFIERININLKPENRPYPYQYFFDNCSTRVRDYLDEAISGTISTQFKDQQTGLTFRDIVRDYVSVTPFFAMSLDILMNSRIDAKVDKYQEMFLPLKLREHFLKLPQVDDEGRVIEGKSLLSDDQTLMTYSGPTKSPVSYYPVFALLFGIPIAVSGFMYVRRQKYSRLVMVSVGAWLVFAGLYGLIMSVSWALSAHQDLHHNANLFIFWPTDFFVGLLFFWWALKPQISGRFKTLVRWHFYAHIVLGLIHLVASGAQLWQQTTSLVALYFGLLMIVTALLMVKGPFKQSH
jgi:hypothetical protein